MAQIRFGLTIQGPGFAFGERKELKYFELLLFWARFMPPEGAALPWNI
jgi:hypothetical protein